MVHIKIKEYILNTSRVMCLTNASSLVVAAVHSYLHHLPFYPEQQIRTRNRHLDLNTYQTQIKNYLYKVSFIQINKVYN